MYVDIPFEGSMSFGSEGILLSRVGIDDGWGIPTGVSDAADIHDKSAGFSGIGDFWKWEDKLIVLYQ